VENRRRSGLYSEVRYWRWWLHREGKVILLGMGVLGLLIAVTAFGLSQADHPSETLEGVVVRFGISSDYDGNAPLVTVRTADRRLHQLHADPSKLIGCTTGAPIRLMKRGAILRVDPVGCRANPRH
jgi:hypothetical protein